MIDAFEYLFWGLIICYLSLFLIGAILGGFIVIGMFLFPEMTSKHVARIAQISERLNPGYSDSELNSRTPSKEVLE